MIEELTVGSLHSNGDIYKSLRVSNAGGIRVWCPNKDVARAVIMTSLQGLHGTGEPRRHPLQMRHLRIVHAVDPVRHAQYVAGTAAVRGPDDAFALHHVQDAGRAAVTQTQAAL